MRVYSCLNTFLLQFRDSMVLVVYHTQGRMSSETKKKSPLSLNFNAHYYARQRQNCLYGW